ncbi:hypothetical protein NrS5_31 [Nitratiruptor phage NrS-5]|uniref:Mor transcription activator family protein n=1 Tax=unclassified Nitratiruptor TaxID=2624044 RepID=UPI0019164699|nr:MULTISPECIES: Mor transcription activator family protein [unclassified Nitratiruptor]BCD61735.1 hypothetical protein NitYY0813_C0595 [Nitratiruptor sp. YY08-13]BCD65670.1 hypothetical protein NitYY0826_C0597 [Nitratiruptor sp. YY08-26]BCD83213.1 hypothetical protein NrS4_31 [Nitratiruptor phage NrS-4]BCD83272.1 hypothetical protein NrS5_31 [Nitratiruptor phage NrS-5]
MTFMDFLESLFDKNIPKEDKVKMLCERYGGTKQTIPQSVPSRMRRKQVYRDYMKINPQTGNIQNTYAYLAKKYGVSFTTIRDDIAKERKRHAGNEDTC